MNFGVFSEKWNITLQCSVSSGQMFEWLKVVTAEHERSCVVEWSSSSYHKKHAGLDNIGLCFSWQKSCAVPGEPDPRQRESFSRAELSPTEEMTSGCIVLYLFGESPLNSLLRWRPRLPARRTSQALQFCSNPSRVDWGALSANYWEEWWESRCPNGSTLGADTERGDDTCTDRRTPLCSKAPSLCLPW